MLKSLLTVSLSLALAGAAAVNAAQPRGADAPSAARAAERNPLHPAYYRERAKRREIGPGNAIESLDYQPLPPTRYSLARPSSAA